MKTGSLNAARKVGIDRLSSGFNPGQHQKLPPKSATQQWTLQSGDTATFEDRTLTYQETVDKTFVDFETNGRNQDLLSDTVLARLRSLEKQQYLPAVGIEHPDGRIEVLDGSSRRAYILSREGAIDRYRILTTKSQISRGDAKALTNEIQSAVEHNLYELGQRAQLIQQNSETKITQKDIALELGISQSKVSRALKTVGVDARIIHLFPNVNDLVLSDYTKLLKVQEMLPLPEAIEGMQRAQFESNGAVFLALSAVETKPKPKVDKFVKEKLADYGDHRTYARKKTSQDGRQVIYEFSRLPEEKLLQLDETIRALFE